jgi:hypothetical protein
LSHNIRGKLVLVPRRFKLVRVDIHADAKADFTQCAERIAKEARRTLGRPTFVGIVKERFAVVGQDITNGADGDGGVVSLVDWLRWVAIGRCVFGGVGVC